MALADLPTLADMAAARIGKPIPKIVAGDSRLERKAQKDQDDERQLKVWRNAVFDRDDGRCRHCEVKVIRLRVQVLNPRRFEAHHIAGRDDKAVRHDTRNGLTLCAKCHQRVTGQVNDKLIIVGTVWFRLGGRRYINGDHAVTFLEVV